jgi:hypothetical protein
MPAACEGACLAGRGECIIANARGDFLILTHAEGRLAHLLRRLLPTPLYVRLLGWTSGRLFSGRISRHL